MALETLPGRMKKLTFLLVLTSIFSFAGANGDDNPSETKAATSVAEHSEDNDKEKKEDEKGEKKEDDKKAETSESEKTKKEDDSLPKEPPPIGNFSLPASQQPAGLFSFGGNIIDESEVQIYFFADGFFGRQKVITDLIPGVLFGITKNWSIFFNFPSTPIMQDGRNYSHGLEDFSIQLEYAFYNKSSAMYVDQATVVINTTFPTGSIHKKPNTGFGAPSLFVGGTYYRIWVDWFVFTCPGALVTASDHGTKYGDQFLYQFGFGRNFGTPDGWIYAWMVEIDGQYFKKNRIQGQIDSNSGGNTIFITPSLWLSSKEFLLQVGPCFPVEQHLFGKQRKLHFAFNLQLAWSFY